MEIEAIRPLADTAFTLDLAPTLGAEAARRVHTATSVLNAACADGRLPGVIEVAAAFRSITVHHDPLCTNRADTLSRVLELLKSVEPVATLTGSLWRLPVCHDPDLAPDLEDIAAATGLTPEAVLDRHLGRPYAVYCIGFLPGFPFMGDIDDRLRLPRRTTPRTRVPAGSVAIANAMTAIYPWESPGGWHLIGRCPVPLFDSTREAPALLTAGDTVQFMAVDRDQFDRLSASLAAGTLDPATFRAGESP